MTYIMLCTFRKKIAPDSHSDILSTKTSERLKQSLTKSFSSHKDKEIHIKQEQIEETEIENEVM